MRHQTKGVCDATPPTTDPYCSFILYESISQCRISRKGDKFLEIAAYAEGRFRNIVLELHLLGLSLLFRVVRISENETDFFQLTKSNLFHCGFFHLSDRLHASSNVNSV